MFEIEDLMVYNTIIIKKKIIKLAILTIKSTSLSKWVYCYICIS